MTRNMSEETLNAISQNLENAKILLKGKIERLESKNEKKRSTDTPEDMETGKEI